MSVEDPLQNSYGITLTWQTVSSEKFTNQTAELVVHIISQIKLIQIIKR